MNTKVLVSLALLVGIGAVLHTVVPPILFGMKPDMMLTMMFLAILLFPSIKNVALVSLTTAVISALTTSFPGGQIANLIDKPITAFVFFALFMLVKKAIYIVGLIQLLETTGEFVFAYIIPIEKATVHRDVYAVRQGLYKSQGTTEVKQSIRATKFDRYHGSGQYNGLIGHVFSEHFGRFCHGISTVGDYYLVFAATDTLL